MIAEMTGKGRSAVMPMFSPHRHLDCVFMPLIEGGAGRLYADDVHNPRVALFCHDFITVVAGDCAIPNSRRIIKEAPSLKPIVVPDSSWGAVVKDVMKWRAISITRTKFAEKAPALENIKRLKNASAQGYSIRPIDSTNIGAIYESLPETGQIMELFWKNRTFAAKSFGYCAATKNGKIASAAIMGTPVREGRFEIQVETARAHRRKGLAAATCAHLIEDAVARGLVPLYDAADDRSAVLAKRLGYASPEKYEMYLPVPTPLFILRKMGVMKAMKRIIRVFKPDFGT